MLYSVKGETEEDATKSQFNITNASMILNLIALMIDKKIVQSHEVLIMTFCRAQVRMYQQALRSWSMENPAMIDVRALTADQMQGSQAPFIIMDTVVTTRLGFLKLRNRVNIACSRAQDGLMIVGDSKQVLNLGSGLRRHFGNVFSYIIRSGGRYEPGRISEKRNQYLPPTFDKTLRVTKADRVDQGANASKDVQDVSANAKSIII